MALSTHSIAAVACLLLLAAPLQAAPGWMYANKAVAEAYQSAAEDVAAVGDALRVNATKAADYAGAKAIYQNGMSVTKESSAAAGAVAVAQYYSAKEILTKNYAALPTYKQFADYYKKPTPLAASIEGAFNNAALCCGARTGTINAVMRAWPFYWTFIKLDMAAAEAAKARPNNQAIQRAVDDAVALWYGNATRQSIFGTAEGYASRRCTNTSSVTGVTSNNNVMFLDGAKAFKAAALKKDKAAMTKAYNKMSAAANAVLMQAFTYNLDESVTPPDGYLAAAPVCLVACGQSVAEGISQGKKATAAAYWYVVAPYLNAKASKETRAVQAILTSPRRLDMNSGKTVMTQARAAATKSGIDWKKQIDGCPQA